MKIAMKPSIRTFLGILIVGGFLMAPDLSLGQNSESTNDDSTVVENAMHEEDISQAELEAIEEISQIILKSVKINPNAEVPVNPEMLEDISFELQNLTGYLPFK